MKEFWNTIQLIFSAVGGWLGYFLGGCDGLLYALIAFVVIDYITGVMCAIINKQLSSEVGFKGIFRKVARPHKAQNDRTGTCHRGLKVQEDSLLVHRKNASPGLPSPV